MTNQPIASGLVTAADLYSVVESARRDIQHVLTKVEVLDDRHRSVITDLADHESRIRTLEGQMPSELTRRLGVLERWQWKAAGAVALLVLLIGVAAGWIGALIGRLH